MSKIRSKNTTPETIIRKILTQRHIHYRLHYNKLPGKPDIYIPNLNTVLFVNGCFWHQHKNCKRSSTPKTNTDYWIPKLKRNVDRQKEVVNQLKVDGYRVEVIWECQTKVATKLNNVLDKILI